MATAHLIRTIVSGTNRALRRSRADPDVQARADLSVNTRADRGVRDWHCARSSPGGQVAQEIYATRLRFDVNARRFRMLAKLLACARMPRCCCTTSTQHRRGGEFLQPGIRDAVWKTEIGSCDLTTDADDCAVAARLCRRCGMVDLERTEWKSVARQVRLLSGKRRRETALASSWAGWLRASCSATTPDLAAADLCLLRMSASCDPVCLRNARTWLARLSSRSFSSEPPCILWSWNVAVRVCH